MGNGSGSVEVQRSGVEETIGRFSGCPARTGTGKSKSSGKKDRSIQKIVLTPLVLLLQMENAKLMGRKWADDSEVNDCNNCHKGFNITVRKHHCRNCGQIFCNECSSKSTAVGNSKKPVRVCDPCYKELNINPTR